MADNFPTNNYNDSGSNKGKSGTGNALYQDEHYLDGDGFIYGVGKISERVLAKPKPANKGGTVYDGLTAEVSNGHALIWSAMGSINATLGIQLADSSAVPSGLEVVSRVTTGDYQHPEGLRVALSDLNGILQRDIDGLYASPAFISKYLFDESEAGGDPYFSATGALFLDYDASEDTAELSLNIDKGLYVDSNDNLCINLFEKTVGSGSSSSIENASGLEFAAGVANVSDNKPAANQLKIKLVESNTPGSDPVNHSGLFLDTPYSDSTTHTQYSGGLKVYHDNTLAINSTGQLGVNASVIVPNITNSYPINITDSGNNKNISLLYNSNNFELGSDNQTLQLKVASTTLGGVKFDSSRIVDGNTWLNAYPGVIAVDGAGDIGVAKATDGMYGTIKIGYQTSGLNRGLLLDSNGKGYVTQLMREIQVAGTPKILSTSDTALNFINGTGTVPDYVNGVKINLQPAKTGTIGGLKVNEVKDTAIGSDQSATGVSNTTASLRIDSANLGFVNVPVLTANEATAGSTKNGVPYSAGYTDSLFARKTEVETAIQTALDGVSGREYVITTKSDMEAGGTYAPIAANKRYICLVSSGGTAPDEYEEYMLITVTNGGTTSYKWEKIGDTHFTSNAYVAKDDYLTQSEVSNIVADVFGF